MLPLVLYPYFPRNNLTVILKSVNIFIAVGIGGLCTHPNLSNVNIWKEYHGKKCWSFLGSPASAEQRAWYFSTPQSTFNSHDVTDHCHGLEESLQAVEEAFAEHGPFDGVLGFSQGAALATMLCQLLHRGGAKENLREPLNERQTGKNGAV